MGAIAPSYGGECLSKIYINAQTHLKWKCKCGHEWKATPNNIKNGRWCPVCGIEKRARKQRSNIGEMNNLAKDRGGRCLSDKYINTDTKLKWMCSKGHIWEAVPDAVKRGTWCPVCNTSKSENICRIFFENLFNNNFPPSWPNWLRNKSGQVLQLDGYCESFDIAFEFQGIQHYIPNAYFSQKGRGSFEKRQKDDEIKKELCRKRGIKLFQIPYLIFEKTPIEEKVASLREFVKSEAKSLEISIPAHVEEIVIDADKIYDDNEIEKIVTVIASKGGKLLEGKYEGGKSLFRIKCNKDHIWFARADHLKRGVWCPYCSGNVKLTLEELKILAKQRDGRCLSEKYINNRTKIKWKCKEGHEWEATADHIKNGAWCPICAGNRPKSIELFKKIAREKNGECISNDYINIHTKLKWRCEKRHEWSATPNSVKRGTWCPRCSGNVKLDLEELKFLAKKRGGKCLSKEYINNRTKLRWKCQEGHEWEAAPAHVKNGTWCRICSLKNRMKSKQR